jgi:hypothetical protein
MVSSGLLRRVALVRTTRWNNPEDTILQNIGALSLGNLRILNPLSGKIQSVQSLRCSLLTEGPRLYSRQEHYDRWTRIPPSFPQILVGTL